MIIHWVLKLFLSQQKDGFEVPDIYNIVTQLHIGVISLLFIRLIFNFCLWRHKFDILLFFCIYCIEFSETLITKEKNVFFSYYTMITMCFISLFLKFKLRDMMLLFMLYVVLYISNVFVFLHDYNYSELLIIAFVCFISIISKSFVNYHVAMNCNLFEKIREKTREIESNEHVMNNVLFNSFPNQWIITLNDKNFTDSRTSKNAFFIRLKIYGFENLQGKQCLAATSHPQSLCDGVYHFV